MLTQNSAIGLYELPNRKNKMSRTKRKGCQLGSGQLDQGLFC